MNPSAPFTRSQISESSRTLLTSLFSHLRATQNSDGGWPFHAGGQSRAEPTCWALLALANSAESAQHIARGLEFLKAQQLPDGSWPAMNGMSSGGSVTSLAALTLAQFPAGAKNVLPALEWLSDDYPRDSSRWQKFLKSFNSAKHESHNDELRGWGWTPRTSSWVEPTSFALLAFASAAPSVLRPQLAQQISQRRALAIGLLYDRMCPGGGWNCGNPRVYGVDGESLILPTCWALLALRNEPDHPHRALSLAWLQKSLAKIASSGSFAVAQITIENYNLPIPAAPRHLTDFAVPSLAEQGTHVAAWAALALNPSRLWPPSFDESSGASRLSPA